MVLPIYLIAMTLAWSIAQTLKYFIRSLRSGHWKDPSTVIFNSGRMPSVHTATVVALVVTVGFEEGVASGMFAISFIVAAIVAYDAMGVRRSSGEQGVVLAKMLKNSSEKIKKPYLALGHTPQEVIVGGFVGAVVGFGVAFFTSSF